MIRLKVDTEYKYISSKIRIFKTENFIKKTKHYYQIDSMLEYIGSGIINSIKSFNEEITPLDYYCLKIENNENLVEFYFVFGKEVYNDKLNINEKDIIFFDTKDIKEKIKKDTRIFDFLSKNKIFFIEIEKSKNILNKQDFEKIYILSGDNSVNFPLLNKEQSALINIENSNVLVQGVAGSGKTNICINKLVQTSLREYGGRVLYSTFSKSLLNDIKSKLELFRDKVNKLNNGLKNHKIKIVDDDEIRAVETSLGVYLDINDSKQIIPKLDRMEEFLSTHIDLFLIEDLAKNYHLIKKEEKIINENYFIKDYVPNIKNYTLLNKYEKIKYLSYEIIYKEIYGLIFGYNIDKTREIISLKEYKDLRQESFSVVECETIYYLAQDYLKFLKNNNYLDNNILTIRLLNVDKEKYSLVILDEVQDFTRNNLILFKELSRKMFCVGDALQMINPSYFSFALLKNIMFEKDLSNVKQLMNNYRNNAKIQKIIDNLSKINTQKFGVHNFVLQSKTINTEESGKAYYIEEDVNNLSKINLSNLTLVCNSNKEKESLRSVFPNTEILTISEIKGLERNTIIMVNILSSNIEKWKELERNSLNKKTSNENSVYRYYFNLFYVGVTRAKHSLYVIESKNIELFKNMFLENFEILKACDLDLILQMENIQSVISSDELITRIDEFVKLLQFDNARFVAEKLSDTYERKRQLNKINAYEECGKTNDLKHLGSLLWKYGFIEEAKTQFRLSKDYDLIQLIDACQGNSVEGINVDIVEYLPLVTDNKVAVSIIVDAVKDEINSLKNLQEKISKKCSIIKENK